MPLNECNPVALTAVYTKSTLSTLKINAAIFILLMVPKSGMSVYPENKILIPPGGASGMGAD